MPSQRRLWNELTQGRAGFRSHKTRPPLYHWSRLARWTRSRPGTHSAGPCNQKTVVDGELLSLQRAGKSGPTGLSRGNGRHWTPGLPSPHRLSSRGLSLRVTVGSSRSGWQRRHRTDRHSRHGSRQTASRSPSSSVLFSATSSDQRSERSEAGYRTGNRAITRYRAPIGLEQSLLGEGNE